MGKKTSVYLSDSLYEAVFNSSLSLADLIRFGLNVKPRMIEEPHDDWTWTTWWFCDPPPKDTKFRVLREAWHRNIDVYDDAKDGCLVREIYEIEPSVMSEVDERVSQ